MELTSTKKLYYYIASFLLTLVLSMGAWWLYLLFSISKRLNNISMDNEATKMLSIVKWEGTFFIFLIFAISLVLIVIFINERKKTRSISSFFASMTHELKTPLASIRLQGQVIDDLVANNDFSMLQKYTERLRQDTIKLEDELNRSLQLARIERDGSLTLKSLNLHTSIQKVIKNYNCDFDITIPEQINILADDSAMETIFKNLIENSIRHVKKDRISIKIDLVEQKKYITVRYRDNGDVFKGDMKKLGHLFYKYDSPKGSGIGIYLIHKLAKAMGGKLLIKNKPSLEFDLYFSKVTDE